MERPRYRPDGSFTQRLNRFEPGQKVEVFPLASNIKVADDLINTMRRFRGIIERVEPTPQAGNETVVVTPTTNPWRLPKRHRGKSVILGGGTAARRVTD
ncbi:MAG: hypothetical protein HYS86_05555 [Candidatus Chisholmbacteria bacterium]|nr:hypothetical protein [Candidatus Chisholmbacteria bacterium]